MSEEIEFPATMTVHWPTGPVQCCQDHADKLVALGNRMGVHAAVTIAPEDAECSNCINEDKLPEDKTDA